MRTVNCSICGDALPKAHGYCARCAIPVSASEITLRLNGANAIQGTPDKEAACKTSRPWSEVPPGQGETTPTLKLTHKLTRMNGETSQESAEAELTRKLAREKSESASDQVESTLNLRHMRRGARERLEADVLISGGEILEEDQDDETLERHSTWQRVVEHKMPPELPTIALYSSDTGRKRRWSVLQPGRHSPHAFFWLNTLALCALFLAGGFGVVLGFARGASHAAATLTPTLQASPATIALGGILTLRGTHFTPRDSIALNRDGHTPMVDTGGVSHVQADKYGFFSDTIVVDPAWLSGTHTLYATDTRAHQQALFKLIVTGQDALQGPPHLLLSTRVLNLGSGDEATNGSKLLALSNAGGGQVSWQATSGQPWLQISPRSGSIASGSSQPTIVAVDRSGLAPGSYHTSLLFVSNTEQISLLVTMQVVPLRPEHEAVLQLAPAALAFSGSAQGPEPQTQTITVSNPGVQTLTWDSSVNLQNGFGWLWMTPQTGSIAPGAQQRITLGVTTRNLPPNVYRAALIFTNQSTQPVQGSPQNVFVSLTVTPACTLVFAPNSLSFAGVHGQAAPSDQMLQINVAQGCAMSQIWSASVHTVSGGNWLHLSNSSSSTPSSTQVGVNTTGLGPGTYGGTLAFTVNTGPQIVPVTLTISPVPCTISGPATLSLQGTAGQTGPVPQTVTVNTGGDCPQVLNWKSAVDGITWLSAVPSGILTQPGTAGVNVQANLTGLSAGTYTGALTITVSDSTTGTTLGTIQTTITLTVLPQCTLQAALTSPLTFTASVGSNPAAQGFTVDATGNCAGNVTITPSVSSDSSSWLTISGPLSIASGSMATFSVTIVSSALLAGPYNGTITLVATDGNGAIAGSPQTVSISLTLQ